MATLLSYREAPDPSNAQAEQHVSMIFAIATDSIRAKRLLLDYAGRAF
jgi:hypothetical protein